MLLLSLLMVQAAQAMPAVAVGVPVAGGSPAKPKQVCRKVEATGSRLAAKRICATVQEWDQREREDRETITRMQENTIPTAQ